MWATTSSSATVASGGRSAASSSRTPAPNESWRQTLDRRAPARRASCARFAYAARDHDQQQRRERVDQRVHASASERATPVARAS